MHQPRPIPTERLRTIRGQMVESFSLDELRDLCFELGINWEQLSGDTRDSKTTSLLERLNRQARLPVLLAQIHALRPVVPWALDDLDAVAASPYKGLAFYDRQDTALFFGRERLIGELVRLTGRRSFVAVVGKSGSGKSSIVRAGVVPALRGDRPPPEGVALPPDCRRWAYLEMTPTGKPAEQLAITLTRDLTTAAATQTVLDDLSQYPASAALYLCKYLARLSAPRAFLLIDQFEELFTVCKDETARAAFNAGLLAMAGSGQATVSITLRADFLHHFIDYPQLWEALDQNKFVIRAMNEDELREAVEQPALTTGYELEPGLADIIVRDVGQDAATLPLLSHALLETWRRREGWRLTHAGYNAAGGVGGAIAKTAERAYSALDPAQQQIARRIFLELTELGEGAEDTRRSVPLADLLPGDPAKRAAAEVVLDALYRARLVTADAETAQVTHEAIIREWPALREWLRDNREALRLERRLKAAAAEWSEGGRDASYLYDGAQLAAAREWAANNPANAAGLVCAFLDAATAEEQREAAERERAQQEKLAQAQRLAEEATERERAQARAARTFRWAVVVAVMLMALAGLAAVLALLQGQAARASAAVARSSEGTAVAAQSTTAYEATRAEVNLNEANAARATSDVNELQAEIERDNAVTAFNDFRASSLMNLSERIFESDPLLADRLLLEALAIGGEPTDKEVINALSSNLLTGKTVKPITEVVQSFGRYTAKNGTGIIADYLMGNDALVSSATGDILALLNGGVSYVRTIPNTSYLLIKYADANTQDELRSTEDAGQFVTLDGEVDLVAPILDSQYIVVNYDDATGELRSTQDIEQFVPLNGEVADVTAIPHSPFFVVHYFVGTGELRSTEDIEQFVPLNGEVAGVTAIPDSPYFVVAYYGGTDELHSTEDVGQFVPLNGDVDLVTPILDSPFFVVDYYDATGELRSTEDAEQFFPLNGEVDEVTPILDSNYFVVDYYDATDELRSTEDAEQFFPLNGDINVVTPIPDSHYFVVDYDDATGELRSTEDAEQFFPLNGVVQFVTPIPDRPYFIVIYLDATGELRSTEDAEQFVPLNGEISHVTAIPDSPFFVVHYLEAPNELRSTENAEQFVPLNGEVYHVAAIPDSPFFVVFYDYVPNELRRMESGEVVTDGDGRRVAAGVDLLWAGENGYYFIQYQDGTGEIITASQSLVDLEPRAEQAIYFPTTHRVAVRYADGRVNYIDLNLIEALGGADAAGTLANMSSAQLIAFTCQTLFSDNPEWEEVRLDEYLDFLPDRTPRACKQ